MMGGGILTITVGVLMSFNVNDEKPGCKSGKTSTADHRRSTFEGFIHSVQSPALRIVAKHWHEARGTKRMPSWMDLQSYDSPPYFESLWGLNYDLATGQFAWRFSGGRFQKWVGENCRDARIYDRHPDSASAESQQLLTRIITTGRAARSSGPLFAVGDFVVTGERIALPMSEDGETGDGILGASVYWPPPLLGPIKRIHENMEWYDI
jgi:hypothetical protein